MDEPSRHSGFGIASAIIAAVSLPYFLVIFGVAGYQSVRSGGNAGDMFNFVVGMLIFLGVGICLVGAALGLVGLLQKDRKRVFAVLGLGFNGAISLGIVLLILHGIAKLHH